MDANTKKRYDKAGPQVVKALEKRHFEAYYVSTAAEAVEKVVELIPKEHTVSWGGTATVDALGIKQRLAQEGIALIDRDTAQTPQERQEMLKKALTCGTFLMSSNAISADGQLVNIDGTGNRVAALCFGPEQVIVVAGMNKVAGDLEGAMRRAREVAAPVNAQRFAGLKTPCSVTGLCADCTHLDVDVPNYIQFLRESSTLDVDSMKWDMEDRNLKMTRPAFGGHLMATIICPRFRPCMATVRPGVMKKNAFDEAKANAVEIVKPNFTLTAEDIHTDVTEVVKAAKKLVDLIGADYIVSVGRGISKDVEGGIKLAEELAEVLGGVVGGSRATIDSGWLSADHQVGQTGKTVHPKVYVALGISGAIQHKAGMQDSECIIAVNKNDTAPIFEIADYGICGDLFKVTPMLIEAIKAAKAAK